MTTESDMQDVATKAGAVKFAEHVPGHPRTTLAYPASSCQSFHTDPYEGVNNPVCTRFEASPSGVGIVALNASVQKN